MINWSIPGSTSKWTKWASLHPPPSSLDKKFNRRIHEGKLSMSLFHHSANWLTTWNVCMSDFYLTIIRKENHTLMQNYCSCELCYTWFGGSSSPCKKVLNPFMLKVKERCEEYIMDYWSEQTPKLISLCILSQNHYGQQLHVKWLKLTAYTRCCHLGIYFNLECSAKFKNVLHIGWKLKNGNWKMQTENSD